MEAKIPIPKGWNKRVQSAILQAISLGRHCFVSIVARMANSPNAVDRIVAENEHLKHEVESLRVELRLKDARMARLPSPTPSLLLYRTLVDSSAACFPRLEHGRDRRQVPPEPNDDLVVDGAVG